MTTIVDERPMVRPPGGWTLDDLVELAAADETHRYELSEGNLIVMPPPTVGHNRIANRMLFWFARNGVGEDRVFGPAGVLIKDRVSGRIPDLVVLKESASVPEDTIWVRPADIALVVEVTSPSTRHSDRKVKPDEYARVGIRQYWLVEPAPGPATVDRYELQAEPPHSRCPRIGLDRMLAGPVPELS